MFDLKRSFFNKKCVKEAINGTIIKNEGSVLVYIEEKGEQKIKLSNGSAGEIFAGWSLVDIFQEEIGIRIENIIVPEDLLISLGRTKLIQGQWRILDVVDHIDLEETNESEPHAGEYIIKNNTGIVKFNKAQLNHTMKIYYKYELTALEVNKMYRGGYISLIEERCSIGSGCGVIYTDQYDITQDFCVGDYVKSGSDGLVTLEGNGTIIGVVEYVPNIDDPLLGIKFDTDRIWPEIKRTKTKKRKFNRYSSLLEISK